jgi:uncharacterized protein (DUF2236 family)
METHATATPPVRLADITREAYIYFGAGATVATQMAHPVVGRGVARHSVTLERPLQRLRNTMSYVYAITLGGDAEREAIARLVNRAHRPVRGDGYSAFDGDAQLWVAATLYRGAVDLRELFVGPLDPASADQVYSDAAAYGTTLQVEPEAWPATRAAFDAYWARSLVGFTVDDEVRNYMQAVLGGGSAPWAARALLPLQRFVTRGLLPARLREAFGLPWSATDARRWEWFRRAAPKMYRALPAVLRHLPARACMRDLRRRIAANAPELAAAGHGARRPPPSH